MIIEGIFRGTCFRIRDVNLITKTIRMTLKPDVDIQARP